MSKKDTPSEFEPELCRHYTSYCFTLLGSLLSLYTAPIRAMKSMEAVLKNPNPEAQADYCKKIVSRPIKMSPHFETAFRNLLASKGVKGAFSKRVEDLTHFLTRDELVDFTAITYLYKLTLKRVFVLERSEFTNTIALIIGIAGELQEQEPSLAWNRMALPLVAAECGAQLLAIAENKKWRTQAKTVLGRKQLFCQETERHVVGCSRFDVAAILTGKMGLGVEVSNQFISYANGSRLTLDPDLAMLILACERAMFGSSIKVSKLSSILDAGAIDFLESLQLSPERWTPEKVWLTSTEMLGGEEMPIREQGKVEVLEPAVAAASAKQKVLIVDDEVSCRSIIQRILSKDFECILAEDGQTAAKIFSQEVHKGKAFDLVILDLMLPDMYGLELMKLIKAAEETGMIDNSKVLVLSGVDGSQQVVDAYENGVDGYLTKPINAGELKTELGKLGFTI